MGEFIDLSGVDLNDTFEPILHTDGEEANLRFVSVLEGNDKNGSRFMMPFFEIPEDPYSKEFGDYMPIPSDEMSPKEKNAATLKIAGFADAFDVDFSVEIDIKQDIVGKTGWAILGVGKDQDGLPTNKIRKFVRGA